MIGKITIVDSFKMMHYISQCSSLSLQAVFNGVLQTVGAVDLQEVKLICSRTNKISWLWHIHQWVLCLHQMLMILGNSHRFYLLPIMEIQSAVFTPYIHIRNCYVVWRNPEKIQPNFITRWIYSSLHCQKEQEKKDWTREGCEQEIVL